MHMIHNSSMSPYEIRLASGDVLDVHADGALFGIIDENMLPRYKAFSSFEIQELTEEQVEIVLEKFAEAGRTPEQGLSIPRPTPEPAENPPRSDGDASSEVPGTSPALGLENPPPGFPAAPMEAVASTITKLEPTLVEKPIEKLTSKVNAKSNVTSSKVQTK